MRKNIKYIFLTMILIVGLFIYFGGITYAKYVFNSFWDYIVKTEEMYISSDNLSTLVTKNVDNQWLGESVHFNILNYINESLISDIDINYNLSCTIMGDAAEHAECKINESEDTLTDVIASSKTCVNNTNDGVDSSSFDKENCELKKYNWVTQKAVKDNFFDIVLTDESYEITDLVVNITLNTTSPFKTTLSGIFTLHKSDLEEDKITADYKNYLSYDSLIVSNSYLSDKCVKVSWNADNLAVAVTDDIAALNYDTNGNVYEIKFNIGAKKSLNYTFYKRNFDIIYKIDEFIIEESDGC